MSNLLPLPLTPKEKKVLEYIETFFSEKGYSPSYLEIRDHFGLASFNSVQNYLKQLSSKGYIQVLPHQKRAIQLLVKSNLHLVNTKGSPRAPLLQARGEVLNLPLMGTVAAGLPIERIAVDEFVEVPPSFVSKVDSTFALRVSGYSMKDDGILDGDIILVEKRSSPTNGELIVAMIDSEATVKRFYAYPKNPLERRVELRPSNETMTSMWYAPSQVKVEGRVIGLIRRF